jgi:hypothetical protein
MAVEEWVQPETVSTARDWLATMASGMVFKSAVADSCSLGLLNDLDGFNGAVGEGDFHGHGAVFALRRGGVLARREERGFSVASAGSGVASVVVAVQPTAISSSESTSSTETGTSSLLPP